VFTRDLEDFEKHRRNLRL